MFDFQLDAALPKSAQYADLLSAIDAVTRGESDSVANMANAAALIWQFLPDLNWAGFYRNIDGELVLGPFVGRPACIRIAWGQGVCGTAAATGTSHVVDDVSTHPNHIACDSASRSELVVPVLQKDAVVAVIDLDSPIRARFDKDDAMGMERIAALLAQRI